MRRAMGYPVAAVGMVALFLTLLALPVSAQTRVGTITSDSQNGTYKVAWAARGGCNAAYNGSVTGTVTGGSAQLLGAYAVSNDCNYTWTVTFTQPNGNQCTATAAGGTVGTPAVTVSVDTSKCLTRAAADTVTISVIGEGDSADAVKATIWNVVATPSGRSANPKDCSTQRFATKLSSNQQKADLKGLILTGINSANCEYNIAVELKPGFQVATSNSNVYRAWESGDGDQTLKLAVSTREVYVTQNVTGQAADNSQVEYTKTVSCVADPSQVGPALPPPVGNTQQGGITIVPQKTLVTLQTGRFNVTAVLSTQKNSQGQPVILQAAVDDDGDPCVVSVSLGALPAECSVDSNSKRANLASATSALILEFAFVCKVATPTTTTTTAATTTTTAPPTTTTQSVTTTTTPDQTMSSVDATTTTTTSPPAPSTTVATGGPIEDRPTG